MRSVFALWLALLAPIQGIPEKSTGDIRREGSVGRVLVEAFVTDSRGDPIQGLTPSDFRATLDGIPATVESVEWIPASPAITPPLPAKDTADSRRRESESTIAD